MVTISYRPACPDDLEQTSRLLAQSYTALLRADYSVDVLANVLPIITRARPELLASGTYWVAQQGLHIVAAGGWTQSAPNGAGGGAQSVGHVRHVATHPNWVRRGIAKTLMSKVMAQAREKGIFHLECLSTLTAVPFYASVGFQRGAPVDVTLTGGVMMQAIQMYCDL